MSSSSSKMKWGESARRGRSSAVTGDAAGTSSRRKPWAVDAEHSNSSSFAARATAPATSFVEEEDEPTATPSIATTNVATSPFDEKKESVLEDEYSSNRNRNNTSINSTAVSEPLNNKTTSSCSSSSRNSINNSTNGDHTNSATTTETPNTVSSIQQQPAADPDWEDDPGPIHSARSFPSTPSSPRHPASRRVSDIPELPIPVKAQANDFECGLVVQRSSSKDGTATIASHDAAIFNDLVQEGAVGKKVERVELTGQQLLRRELAKAAANVALRRQAEEAARRAAVLALDAAIEKQQQLDDEAAAAAAAATATATATAAAAAAAAVAAAATATAEALQLEQRQQAEDEEAAAVVLREQQQQQQVEADAGAAATAVVLQKLQQQQQQLEAEQAAEAAAALREPQQQAEADTLTRENFTVSTGDYNNAAIHSTDIDGSGKMILTSSEPVVAQAQALTQHQTLVKISPSSMPPTTATTTTLPTDATQQQHLQRARAMHRSERALSLLQQQKQQQSQRQQQQGLISQSNSYDSDDGQKIRSSSRSSSFDGSVVDDDEEMDAASVIRKRVQAAKIKAARLQAESEARRKLEAQERAEAVESVRLALQTANETAGSNNAIDCVDQTETPLETEEAIQSSYRAPELNEDDDEEEDGNDENEEHELHTVVKASEETPHVMQQEDETPKQIARKEETTKVGTKIEEFVDGEAFHDANSSPSPVKVESLGISSERIDMKSSDEKQNLLPQQLFQQEQLQQRDQPRPPLAPSMAPLPSPPAPPSKTVSFDQMSVQSDSISLFSIDSAMASVPNAPSSSLAAQPSPRKTISEIIRRDLWNSNENIVEAALMTLSEKAASHVSYRSAMARAGGILAIVRAMEQHIAHAGTQIAACRALEKLALDTENELAIGEVGGVEAILGAMMAHFTDSGVQEAAWSALWNCTCGNACDTMTIDTQGGMGAIVSCMKQHVDNPVVQVGACGTLSNLCLDNEDRLTALAEADGFAAIAQAMQRHWDNPVVRNEACYTMVVLLEKNAQTHDETHDTAEEEVMADEQVFEEAAL